MRKFAAMLALTLGLAAAGLAPASAHASMVASDPADGASLDRLPSKVTLTFNEPVGHADVAVFNPDGTPVSTPVVRQVDQTVTATLGASDQRGTYTIAYRIVSTDGHPVSHELRFTVTTGRTVTEHAPKTDVASTPEAGHHTVWWTLLVVVVGVLLVLVPLRRK